MAEATAPPQTRAARSFNKHLAIVCAACVAVPLFIGYLTGSIGIPHNDDWAFFRILFGLADTGELDLVGWNEMMLVGHLGVALPVVKVLGHDITALNTFVALVSGAGLYVFGLVARRFLEPFHALLAVFLVGIFPGFAALVATFMTDNTAFTAQMLCVLLGLVAFERKGASRDYLVGLAILMGLFAFSIREFAILAPLAVVGGYFVANRRDRRSWIRPVVALAVVLAGGYLLYHLRHLLPGDTSHFFRSNFSLAMVPYVSQALFTFSLALAPAVMFAVRGRGWAPRYWGAGAVVMIGLATYVVTKTQETPTCCYHSSGSVFMGNLLTQRGSLGNQALVGTRPVLFPTTIWLLLSAIAIAAAAAIVTVAVGRLLKRRMGTIGSDPGLTTLFLLGALTGGAIVFRHALGGPLFDRYVVVPIAVAVIFLLRTLPAPRSWAHAAGPLVAAAALTLVGIVLVGGSASFDSARWRAGEIAVRAGIPARDVDAGFEWVGFHYGGVTFESVLRRSAPVPPRGRPVPGRTSPSSRRTGPPGRIPAPGYMNMFLDAGNCGLVAASELKGPAFELIERIDYSQWLGLQVRHLWVYRYRPGCEAAAAFF